MKLLGELFMSLQFKQLNTQQPPTPKQPQYKQSSVQRQIVPMTVLGAPFGSPIAIPPRPVGINTIRQPTPPPPPQVPGEGLKRAINYYADYAGCGWWRMIMPEMLACIENKAIINGLSTMIVDPRFYHGINAVRLQRQATPVQLEFVKFLKEGAKKTGLKMIYEIDDIIFKDDIPDFNRCKVAFEDETILKSSMEMMRLCDEISVTCQYMKDYYMEKTSNKNITVIPNYPARWWMDNHYWPDIIMRNYEKHQKKPRIAYIGSGTHIDVTNRTNQVDDFHHVVDAIIQTRKEFHWIFVGAFPLRCKPFIDRGEMEFRQWFPLKDLAKAYTVTECQAVYAPLMDCTFNKSKSNIKYLEAACCGIPGVFQDLITYQQAPLRFKTGVDLIDQLRYLLANPDRYNSFSTQARAYADTMWLDDHIDEHVELLFTRIGDPDRKKLLVNNPDQVSDVTFENRILKGKL